MAVSRTGLRLRQRLLPYLHTMNHRAARDGAPLVQPMYWSHPEAAEAYQVPNQFTFGTELLVAPITSPNDPRSQLGSVRAWLPEGTWIDIFTGLVYTGGRQLSLHRDLTGIPVLARAGGIVPLNGDMVPGNAPDNPAELEILVVVGADGAFELIEDDGAGSGLDPATVVRTPIVFNQLNGWVTVGPAAGALACVPAQRGWRIVFLGLAVGAAAVIMVDGTALAAQVSDQGARVTVSISEVPVTGTLRVEVGPNPALAGNNVHERLFTLLDRAQIAYDAKQRIYAIASSNKPLSVRLSHLQALDLDRRLETAVGEILLARDVTADAPGSPDQPSADITQV